MALLKNLTNSKVKMYLVDEEEDDQKKLKAEREAREKAAREAREKAAREAREKAAKEAARKKAAESQAAKTAKERDAEEKKFFEDKSTVTPIKAMHQAGKTGVAQYTDADTGEYKAKTVPTASDYAKEIAWREAQDEKVYEDRKAGWRPSGKGDNSTTYSQPATTHTPINTPSAPTPEPTPGTSIRPYGVKPTVDDYLLNLYDIDEVVDTEYKDQYFGLNSKFIENQIGQRGWNLANFKEEEIDLAGRYPLKTLIGYENMKTAINMEGYIADKHNLSNEDNTKVNAWKHAYLAALHKEAFGTDIATKFVNAHENTTGNLDIYRDRAVMDLHNNAVGLSIDRPMGMGDEEFADYVYEIVEEDGYWIMPEGEMHIPDWAKQDVKD